MAPAVGGSNPLVHPKKEKKLELPMFDEHKCDWCTFSMVYFKPNIEDDGWVASIQGSEKWYCPECGQVVYDFTKV